MADDDKNVEPTEEEENVNDESSEETQENNEPEQEQLIEEDLTFAKNLKHRSITKEI